MNGNKKRMMNLSNALMNLPKILKVELKKDYLLTNL